MILGHPHKGQYICADVHDSVRTRAICDLLLYLPAKLRSSDVSIFSILLLPFAAFFHRPISKQAQPDCFFSSPAHLLSLTYKHHYSRQARKKQWANCEFHPPITVQTDKKQDAPQKIAAHPARRKEIE
ncbi:MAG: hypothetical protein LUF77_02220 [Oscillospiraceae bacterium]|nr:hypothetical protein [Oscillospiraceae bacterium]